MNVSPHLLILLLALVLSLKPARLPNLFSKHNKNFKTFKNHQVSLVPFIQRYTSNIQFILHLVMKFISYFQTHKELREIFIMLKS